MKKHILSFLMLFATISIAMAQPAMMTKGQVSDSTQVDTNSTCQDQELRISVEIVPMYGNDHFSHPQHPATGVGCPLGNRFRFTTSQIFSWYQWETSFHTTDPGDTDIFLADAVECGYVKVTVKDSYCRVGTDSIWFNLKDHISPLGDFIMEIGDDLYPTFSGIATSEHYKLALRRGYKPGEEGYAKDFFLSPGKWTYKNYDAHYQEDTTWMFNCLLYDTCQRLYNEIFIPGMLLETAQEDSTWHLNLKTMLHIDYNHHYEIYGFTFVYFVYSIDKYNNRHRVLDEDDNPIVLPPETTSWQIPGPRDHPYYQCGVAKVLDNGGYELVSLSNKVANPLYYEIFNIQNMESSQTYGFCVKYDHLQGAIVYGKDDCPGQTWDWEYDGESFTISGDSIIMPNDGTTRHWDIVYHGCDEEKTFRITSFIPYWVAPFEDPYLWKHQGCPTNLVAIDDEIFASGDFNCLWSTGETTNSIEVIQPGDYSVTIGAFYCLDSCSVQVRNNVEVSLVTVDLKTGRDKVFWQTTPEQAKYIDKVKVIRYDGSAYNAPYSQGYYLFSGIEDIPRNYHIIAVTKEGQNCPVISYERGTIHATCHESLDSIITLNWNIPYIEQGSPDNVIGFQICKYNSATQEVTVVKELDATDTSYTGNSSPFVGSRAVVAALFSNGERAFSNISSILDVDENQESLFTIYPNPAQGQFTVEGTGRMTITNLLGQTVLAKEIDGQMTLELPPGMYFVKLGNATRKVVVE